MKKLVSLSVGLVVVSSMAFATTAKKHEKAAPSATPTATATPAPKPATK